jgi:RNA polymerase sigma-70 factor (ECF subfamily)
VDNGLQNEKPESPNWELWLERHAAAFLLFARQQVRAEADAPDLVQDAIVECARRIANGAPPPVGLVFATIRRRAVDLARSDARRANRESAVGAELPAAWFDSGVEDHERDLILEEAMRQLPQLYREVLTLKVWGELTFTEIGEALEISQNTAASRYRYGLEELRKLTKEILN